MIRVENGNETSIDIYVLGLHACDDQDDTFHCGTVHDIRRAFVENGFSVTDDAIWHNYDAWCNGNKASYEDKENGYALVSPCGREPLCFHVEALKHRTTKRNANIKKR